MQKKDITDTQAWQIIKPVCRELSDLVDGGSIEFISGTENGDGTCTINLKSRHFHIASRGLKDSIGDIEYNDGKIRVGLRSNGMPANIFIDLMV